MIQEIKYRGYTTTPDDYQSPDGDLRGVANLLPDGGSLRPIPPAEELLELTPDEEMLFVHETPSYRRYIIRRGQAVRWIPTDGGDGGDVLTLPEGTELHQATAIGNTLMLLTSEGIEYLLSEADNPNDSVLHISGYHYRHLGRRMPECPLSFGLRGQGYGQGGHSVSFAPSQDGSVSKEAWRTISQTAMGVVNKFLREEADARERFAQPFFVRYAYRLYDGTLTMHSAPVLMLANIDAPMRLSVEQWDYFKVGNIKTGVHFRANSLTHRLDYALLDAGAREELRRWRDIIVGIEVFVSAPIYTYDQSGEVERTERTPADQVAMYSVCSLESGGRPDPQYLRRSIVEVVANMGGEHLPEAFVLPRNDDRMREQYSQTAHFYHIATLEVESLSTQRTEVHIPLGALRGLTTRERMSDDYHSHDTLSAQQAYIYNGRLNLSGIRRRLFEGFRIDATQCYNAPLRQPLPGETGGLQQTYCRVCIKASDGSVDYTLYTPIGVYHETADMLYYYHPHPRAYELTICLSGVGYTYPLTPHDHLVGAYYLGHLRGKDSNRLDHQLDRRGQAPRERPTEDVPWSNEPNKVYTSDVSNPLVFPPSSIVSVGIGRIIGISSATKAISQGQFGQHPLYAFTSEGVWALSVGPTGTYQALQPITRDVCLSAESITQIDSGVLFASDRGIMLLEGGNAVCISESIGDLRGGGSKALPQSEQLARITGIAPEALDIKPWGEYLRGARMLYDYRGQRIWVYNRWLPYAYVYSMRDRLWGMKPSDLKSSVPAYPEALALTHAGKLVNVSADSPSHLEAVRGVLTTRPLKLGMPSVHKTIRRVIQRGVFRQDAVQSILYGSNDLLTWRLVGSSSGHRIGNISGSPYRYFVIVVLCQLEPGESLYGCTIEYEPKLTNQPR